MGLGPIFSSSLPSDATNKVKVPKLKLYSLQLSTSKANLTTIQQPKKDEDMAFSNVFCFSF